MSASRLAPAPYYRVEITRYPALTTEAEAELFADYRRRRTAKKLDVIVKQYLYWAAELACRYSGARLEKADAISAANYGLMRAIETFDPSLGRRFVTHSYFSIRKQVLLALYQSFPVNPEPGIQALRHTLNKSGRTEADVQAFAERSKQVFSEVAQSGAAAPCDAGVFALDDHQDTRADAERQTLRDALSAALHLLSDDMRRVVELRYFSPRGATFVEIAKVLKCKTDHAAYLHDRALVLLRRPLTKVRKETR